MSTLDQWIDCLLSPRKVRYLGRSPLLQQRRALMSVGWFLVSIWQVALNGAQGIFAGILLLVPAVLLRCWRSWPYVSLNVANDSPYVEIRNLLAVHRVPIESSSTLRLNAKWKAGIRHCIVRVETPEYKISSRAKIGGEAGLAELLHLADQWESAGGYVTMDSWVSKFRTNC